MSEKLAINGGKPVRSEFLPYARQQIDNADVVYMNQAVRSDRITTGEWVEKYENAFAEYHGAKYGIAVSSGTAALMIVYKLLFWGHFRHLIISPLTFTASVNVAWGLCSIEFRDINRNTLFIENDSCPNEHAVTVLIDYAGHKDERFCTVRDACHSIGMPFGNSTISCYSTHAVKNITTGEGGMILTNDEIIAGQCRRFRDHGRDATGDMVEFGYNFRLPDINCALGWSQLQKLGGWIQRRREIAQTYKDAFADVDGITLPAIPLDESSWHLFPILVENRDRVRVALEAENIGTQIHYRPVYYHTYYQNLGYKRGLCPNAEWIYERILSIPLFPAMADDDVQDVITAVKKVVQFYRETIR